MMMLLMLALPLLIFFFINISNFFVLPGSWPSLAKIFGSLLLSSVLLFKDIGAGDSYRLSSQAREGKWWGG